MSSIAKQKIQSADYKQVFNYLWQTYKKFPRNGIIALVARIISTAVFVVPPLYYKQIIDLLSSSNLASTETAAHAIGLLMMVLWVQIGSFITFRLYDYFSIHFEMDIQEWLNNIFLEKLQLQSFQFFSDNFTGSLISKFRKGVAAFERITDILARDIIPFIVNITLILIIVGLQSRYLAGGILLTVIIFSRVQYKLYIYIYPYQEKSNALDSELGGLLSDIVTNNQTIKIFASEKGEQQDYAKLNYATVAARKEQYFKAMRIWSSSGAISIILQIGIIYIAIRMRGIGLSSIGMIVLLQNYIGRIMDFLRGLGHTFRNTFRAVSEAGEILEIIQTPFQVIDQNNQKLEVLQGTIQFQGVTFAYDEKNPVFDQLSFQIKAGEKIGLVGPSGGGKTTIGKLLLRFYDLQGGSILIDGQDISQVSQESLRKHIGMIPQDPILFHRSLRENIAYGKPDATEEEIIAAAKMARCHEFISKLPQGYETLVGERGIKLSGGERQRVAIARAILENAPILILDEATSALDSESEEAIQQAMDVLMQNKTVLIIAHRLSTIMKMDKIFVIEQGQIVEKGSHKELLLQQGIYEKLRNIQSGGFIGSEF